MRGPQFMLGYWKEPDSTTAVLRDGWYWSGDIVTRDREGFYRVVDRRKEMIKYKGFPVAPAEVEAVLLEHPAVKECGVVGRLAVKQVKFRWRSSPCATDLSTAASSKKNSAASSPTGSRSTSSRAKSLHRCSSENGVRKNPPARTSQSVELKIIHRRVRKERRESKVFTSNSLALSPYLAVNDLRIYFSLALFCTL